MTHENTLDDGAMPKPFCSTCGKDVAEILRPVCAKWWHDNDPLHTQSLAAGYASVAEWVAGVQAEVVRFRLALIAIEEAGMRWNTCENVPSMARAALGDPQ